jgi:hypothetical protein
MTEDYSNLINSIKKLKIKPQIKKEPEKVAPPKQKIKNKQEYDDSDIFIIQNTKEYYVKETPKNDEQKLSSEEIRKKQIQEAIYKKVYEETRLKLAKEREAEENAKKYGTYVEPTRKQLMTTAMPMKYSAMTVPAVDIIRAQTCKGTRNYNPSYE